MTRALMLLGLLGSLPAGAAPKIAVVMVSAEGLSTEQADALAYDVAAAAATQIEGEAIAGASVRDKMPPDQPSEGCEDSPACGRKLAAALEVDEVLLLSAHMAGKTMVVSCHRVPREPTRPPSEQPLRLLGNKAKRAKAMLDLVTALYPSGTVKEFVAPPPAPEDEAVVVRKAPREERPPSDEGPKRPAWVWGLIGGGAAAAVLALVLGLTLGLEHSPTAPAVTLP